MRKRILVAFKRHEIVIVATVIGVVFMGCHGMRGLDAAKFNRHPTV